MGSAVLQVLAISDERKCEQEDELRSSKEGDSCGTDVAIQKKCGKGLTCVMPTNGPIGEHTAGTCVKHPASR